LVHGELLPIRIDGQRVRFGYLGRDSRLRALEIGVDPEPTRLISSRTDHRRPELAAAIEWLVPLAPNGSTRLSWRLAPAEVDVVDRSAALTAMAAPQRMKPTSRRAAGPSPSAVSIRVDDAAIQRIVDRALEDLELLHEDGPRTGEGFVAAGLPWFAALFGRDALLTAYEAVAFRPELAVEALTVLADHQAADGDRHGGEPGQMLHELRTGEMARLGEVPFGPSFGSVDATPLWLLVLGEANDWIGDPALVARLWPAALAALHWIEARTRPDPDGFLRYVGRPGALANEGWKDSPDSIRDRSGAIVPGPIALAEVQGYLYDAYRRLARVARWQADPGLADRLDRRARRLRGRFEAEFWIPDRGFPAMAIGRDGQAADAIASNPGQCLGTGLLGRAGEVAVARRILAGDMVSGGGIRTLAASEPAFDPLGYHIGSVWPHDTALIVGGLKRAGFDEAAVGVADRLLEAAGVLPAGRLPELVSGSARRAGHGPGAVPNACQVQAWASAAPLHLVRALLGLEADAKRHRLVLRRPALPTSVGRLTIAGLALGVARVDLEVTRRRTGLQVRATAVHGPLDGVLVRRSGRQPYGGQAVRG
jgi:glycogen debranching enzyme